MSRDDKLFTAIRANPQGAQFNAACKEVMRLGFTHWGGKCSRRTFNRSGEPYDSISRIAAGSIRPVRRGDSSP